MVVLLWYLWCSWHIMLCENLLLSFPVVCLTLFWCVYSLNQASVYLEYANKEGLIQNNPKVSSCSEKFFKMGFRNLKHPWTTNDRDQRTKAYTRHWLYQLTRDASKDVNCQSTSLFTSVNTLKLIITWPKTTMSACFTGYFFCG